MAEQSQHRALPLREAAVHVVRVLCEAGHVAYFAGGCVRDRLLGHEVTDYDVATDARPETIRGLFRRAHSVGEAFGVVLVRHGGHCFDVATFRSDGVYSDRRRPDDVTFGDARHDALRRDFTINGLFEDPLEERVIDYVGGQADLERGVVRAIGDAAERLTEDPLRMLRAVRFAARFSFEIEAATADAIRSAAGDLAGVSRERIGQEIRRMLTHPNRGHAAWEVQYLGLDGTVLGETPRTVAPTRVGRLPDDADFPTALAAWLLDRHAGQEGTVGDLRAVAERWADRLMVSNHDREGLLGALEVHAVLTGGWRQLGVARQKRLAAGPWFRAGLALLQAADRQAFVDVQRRVQELRRAGGLAPPPLIDGSDLIAIGLVPGPPFKRILAAVYDAQLEGAVRDADAALRLARLLADGEP